MGKIKLEGKDWQLISFFNVYVYLAYLDKFRCVSTVLENIVKCAVVQNLEHGDTDPDCSSRVRPFTCLQAAVSRSPNPRRVLWFAERLGYFYYTLAAYGTAPNNDAFWLNLRYP